MCNARVKREWSENLRQDRCCEVELQINATGESREGVCSVEAESEDLPVKLRIVFFGFGNDMCTADRLYLCVFLQNMIDRSVNVFCFCVQ